MLKSKSLGSTGAGFFKDRTHLTYRKENWRLVRNIIIITIILVSDTRRGTHRKSEYLIKKIDTEQKRSFGNTGNFFSGS